MNRIKNTVNNTANSGSKTVTIFFFLRSKNLKKFYNTFSGLFYENLPSFCRNLNQILRTTNNRNRALPVNHITLTTADIDVLMGCFHATPLTANGLVAGWVVLEIEEA